MADYVIRTDFNAQAIVYAGADRTIRTIGAVIAGDFGVLPAGTMMGEITSGPDAGKFGPYDDGAGDGREVCVGVLMETADTGLSTNVPPTDCDRYGWAIAFRGNFYLSQLTGLDAAADADLFARRIASRDLYTF